MRKLRFGFTGSTNTTLAAKIDLPDIGESTGYGIFAHCFTCGKDLKIIKSISEELITTGLSVLRFDFAGIGESSGDFSDTTYSTTVEDIICAAEYLQDNYLAPDFLIGHSMGGAAVLSAAQSLDSVKAVALIATPFDLRQFHQQLTSRKMKVQPDGSSSVLISGREYSLKKEFFDELLNTDIQSIIGSLKKPVLIVHAAGDTMLNVRDSELLFQSANHPKALVITAGNDHLFNDRKESSFVGRLISSWLTGYL